VGKEGFILEGKEMEENIQLVFAVLWSRIRPDPN
jgi:hypothetical protein